MIIKSMEARMSVLALLIALGFMGSTYILYRIMSLLGG